MANKTWSDATVKWSDPTVNWDGSSPESPSISPSLSPSVSISPSLSSSISPSVSISPSPSPGYQGYTRGDEDILPLNNDNDLETPYSAQDLLDVEEKDIAKVAQTGTLQYMIHQFKDYVGLTTSCNLEWDGQSNLAPNLSIVKLQIYNRNTNEWDDVDSDNLTDANTDFQLIGNITNLTNYKDNNTVISCRVYQEAT